MKRNFHPRWMCTALALFACTAAAAPPRQLIVTRETQDLYRVATGEFYLKTISCYEQVYGDRADLRLNVSGKGGMLLFRSGKTCLVDKFLQEVEPSKITITPRF